MHAAVLFIDKDWPGGREQEVMAWKLGHLAGDMGTKRKVGRQVLSCLTYMWYLSCARQWANHEDKWMNNEKECLSGVYRAHRPRNQ